MAKKRGKVQKIKKTKSKKLTSNEIEKQLLENFVNLQKVLTNLSVKFDALSDNISKLLELFEISAKSFVEKLPEEGKTRFEKEKDKEFLNKIDTLLDQNKTIAKGLTLMEEKLRDRLHGYNTEQERQNPRQRPRYPGF